MERRELIGWMVATGGLAAFNRLSADDLVALGREVHAAPAPRALDARAATTVAIVVSHIIPATDTPGAVEAGVPAFITHMLEQWYPPADRDRFLAGLATLDGLSRARTSREFASADAAGQMAVLQQLDDEVTALRQANVAQANAHWFAMLKYLTVWGYCTSEVGMRQVLHSWPAPMRYDGNARVDA